MDSGTFYRMWFYRMWFYLQRKDLTKEKDLRKKRNLKKKISKKRDPLPQTPSPFYGGQGKRKSMQTSPGGKPEREMKNPDSPGFSGKISKH